MMSQPEKHVIWNGKAGSVGTAAEVRSYLDARSDVQVHETSSPEESKQVIFEACAGGAAMIIVAGGDGTINTVVNAIPQFQPEISLAVLPVGTANDWSWSLGLPDDLAEAVRLIDLGEIRQIDLAEMETDQGTTCFANIATGGNSQRVAETLTPEVKERWGAFCYLRGAIDVMADLQSFETELTFDDGNTEKFSVWNMMVANGRTSAGRMQVAPFASMEDGLLDVIIIRDGDLIDLAQLATGFALNHYTELEQVESRRVKSLQIQSTPGLQFTLDGQLIESFAKAFRVIPQALKVVVGPEYHVRQMQSS